MVAALAVFAVALSFRLPFCHVEFIGSDVPNHLLASLDLHGARFWNSHHVRDNFLAQVLCFNHGYTTILVPWVLYETVFGFLGLTLNESTLVMVNSLLGAVSCLAVYFFVRVTGGRFKAVIAGMIVAGFAAHIGLSRVHAGQQILVILFFYSSLAFLHLVLTRPERCWQFAYWVTTFAYVGCDNAFLLGLGLHVAFVAVSQGWHYRSFIRSCRRLWWRFGAAFAILGPVLLYVAVSVVSVRFGLRSGFLLRLLEKTEGHHSLDLTRACTALLWLTGPLALLLVGVALLDRASRLQLAHNPLVPFLLTIVLLYGGVIAISGAKVEPHYVLYVAIPLACLAGDYRRWVGMLMVVATAIWGVGSIFDLGEVFRQPGWGLYGQINRHIPQGDRGIKALGFLVRTGQLRVSMTDSKYDMVMASESAFYYLGREILPAGDADAQWLLGAADPLLVRMAYPDAGKQGTEQRVAGLLRQSSLHLVGLVERDGVVLLRVYGRGRLDAVARWGSRELALQFDERFGTIGGLRRPVPAESKPGPSASLEFGGDVHGSVLVHHGASSGPDELALVGDRRPNPVSRTNEHEMPLGDNAVKGRESPSSRGGAVTLRGLGCSPRNSTCGLDACCPT